MNILKKSYGKILKALAKLISFLLDVLIFITDLIVNLVKRIGKGIVTLLAMGGCFFIFFLAGPLGLYLLLNPVVFLVVLSLILIPILGTKLVSYLKYIKYITREYLLDKAKYYIHGVGDGFKSFNEYKNRYWRMEEEKWRKEQERRREEQQRMWEERFRQWYEYQNSQRTSGSYGNWYEQNTGYGGQTYTNPTTEFKKKYEESCDLLGVSYDSDKYQIKLAYRQKAKEYHPDLNKSPDATTKFQQINNAYEFLSDGNIERYKNI